MSIDDLWYKNAIIYCLDVEKYQDANGDGIGDFEGLMRRLDYLPGLGVTCVWLQPFYPSPNRDNGYDVSDYYGVHEQARLARRLRQLHESRRRARHPRHRRPRRQPHVDRLALVPAGARATRSRPTATGTCGPTSGRRTTRRASSFPGEQTTTWTLRPAGGAVLLPPLLRAPGRPEHLEPVRARRDPEDHGLLAAARRVGLPHGRRAVPHREEGRRRRAPAGLRPAEGDARLPAVALGRRHPAGRGQRAARREHASTSATRATGCR